MLAVPINAYADNHINNNANDITSEEEYNSPFSDVEATATHRSIGFDNSKILSIASDAGVPASLIGTSLLAADSFPLNSVSLSNATTKESNGMSITIADEVTGDEAYISSLSVISAVTGTAPWDSDDEPGNDSTPNNNIVRSMDAVSYDIEYVITPQADAGHTYYKNARIGFQVVLPESDTNRASFDIDSLGWADTTPGYEPHVDTYMIDGKECQVLTAYRRILATDSIQYSVPGTGTVTFFLDVGFMANGETIQPTFYSWVDGNEVTSPNEHNVSESAACQQHHFIEVVATQPETITVSAAPRYNIVINNGNDNCVFGRGDYDFSTGNDEAFNKELGEINGRLYGFGIELRLQNIQSDKQLRGIEVPNGPIEFDLKISSTISSDGGLFESIDPNGDFRPLVWCLDGLSTNSVKSNGRKISLNGMTYNYLNQTVPFNKRTSDTQSADQRLHCYDGGTWTITPQDENGTIHVTVSDYELNVNWWPSTKAGYPTDSDTYYPHDGEVRNIGIFSTGELWIIQPHYGIETGISALDQYDCDYDASFNVTVSDSSLRATGISGTSLSEVSDTSNQEQPDATGDSATKGYAIRRPGSYDQRVAYTYYTNCQSGTNICYEQGTDKLAYTENYSRGDDSALVGTKLRILTGMRVVPMEYDNIPVGGQYLVKIDPDFIQPEEGITSNNIGILSSASESRANKESLHVLYAAKKDGSNWTDWNEQLAASIEDLKYYDSLQELQDNGDICVGIMLENKIAGSNRLSWHDYFYTFPVVVTDNSDAIGSVAPICADCREWSRTQMQEIVSHDLNRDVAIDDAEAYQEWIDKFWISATDDPSAPNMPNAKYVMSYRHTYTPAVYDSNGFVGGHTGTYNRGDSLYIAGENAKIQKTVAQKTSEESKTVFDMDYMQRYVDYEINPTLEVSQTNVSTDYKTTITITDTLPSSLSYVPGSSYQGGTYSENNGGSSPGTITGGTKLEPLAHKNDDGTTTLTWSFQYSADSDSSNNAQKIHYTAMIGTPSNELTDVTNNQEITNTATIKSTYDKRIPTQAFGNTDSATIRISKLRQSSLAVASDDTFYEVGSTVGFSSNTGNYGENTITNAMSVGLFPYNGDGTTSYHGTYSLKTISIDPSRADGNISDVRLYLTSDPKWRNINYDDLTIEDIKNDSSWIEVPISPDGTCTIPKEVDINNIVGWATTDDRLEPDTSMYIHFDLNTSGNKPGDAYNVSWTDSDNIVTAVSYIIGRQVSGHVFYDTDESGSYNNGDNLIPGCIVSLVDSNTNTIITDLNGNKCTMIADDAGSYLFTNLPAGNFTVKIEPPDGTDWNGYKTTTKDSVNADDTIDSDADPVMSGDDLTSAIITNIYMPTTSEMSNSVYSLEHMDAGIIPPFGFLELIKSSGNSSITNGNNNYSLSGAVYGLWKDDPNCTANNETARITTDSNGHAASEELRNGTYYIKEITPSKGYKLDTNIYTATVLPTKTAQVTSNGNNTLSEPPETITTPTIIKTDAQSWTHGTTTVMNATLANAEFTIKFYTTTNTDEQQSATPERTWVLKSDSNGRIIFDNAHKVSGDEFYTDDNSIILPIGSISWQETKAPTGYVLDNTIHRLSLPSGTETAGTLTATNEPIETSIAITKIWDDDNDRDGLRNDAVFTVIGSVAGSGDIVYNGTLTVKAPTNGTNTATATLENLPAYANGLPVTYTYTEKATTDYTQSLDRIKGTWEDGYTATTTNKHIIQREEYKVKKTWDDDDDRDGLRPDSILFTLTGSDGSTRQVTAAMNAWSASFGSLPVYYNHGTRIEYTLTEANVNGYTLANQTKKAITDNTGKTTGWEINITNTHEPETTSYTAHKTWNDDNDRDGLRPDTLPITLTGSDGSVRTLNATAGNNWSVTFDNLPVKFNHGRNIEYTINENDVPDGYTLDNTTHNNNSYEFVNTHEPRLISIPVVKQWDDDDNRDGLREQDINVTLRGSDGSTRTATFGADDDWSYTFTDLPYYFANGSRIDYTLTETPVNGYTDEIIENITDDSDSFVITNTHVPAKTSLYVHKTWDDDDNRDGLRTDSIKVILTGNDGSTREATYDAESGYSGVFTDLPVYYDNGKIIEYSLTEESIDGYQTTITPISGDSLEGFEIVNKHDVAKRSISIEKTFLDDDDRDGVRPDSIGFVLNGSDGSLREDSISAENDWSAVISDLPVYYDNGTFIDYTVVEDEVPDYTLDSIDYSTGEDGYDNGSIVITNKHDIAVMDIAIDKKWIDDADAVSGDDAGSSRPDSVDVFVDGDDGGSYDVTLSSSDNWHTVLESVPVYSDGGQKVAYSVREGDVDGYENVRVEVGFPSLISDDDGTVKRVLSCEVVNKEIIVPVDLPVPDVVPSIQPPRDNGVADILELAKTGDSPLIVSTALLIATVTASATAIALLLRKKKQQ